MTMWFGLLAGFTIAAVIVAIITHLVGAMMGKYVVILKYIGCAYILYLAWQIYRSFGKAKESDKTCTFLSGMIVQAYQRKDYSLRLNGIHNIRIALFKQII